MTKRRWLHSAIEEAGRTEPSLPWTRNAARTGPKRAVPRAPDKPARGVRA